MFFLTIPMCSHGLWLRVWWKLSVSPRHHKPISALGSFACVVKRWATLWAYRRRRRWWQALGELPQVTTKSQSFVKLLTQRILQGVVEIPKCWIWMDFRGPQNLGRQKHPHLNSASLQRAHVKRPPYPFTPSGQNGPWCENYVRSRGHRPTKPWWIWFWNSVHPNCKSVNTPQHETLSLSSVSMKMNRQTHWSLLTCPYTLSAPPLEPATHSSK